MLCRRVSSACSIRGQHVGIVVRNDLHDRGANTKTTTDSNQAIIKNNVHSRGRGGRDQQDPQVPSPAPPTPFPSSLLRFGSRGGTDKKLLDQPWRFRDRSGSLCLTISSVPSRRGCRSYRWGAAMRTSITRLSLTHSRFRVFARILPFISNVRDYSLGGCFHRVVAHRLPKLAGLLQQLILQSGLLVAC